MKIGVFDSGLGGLTILRAVRAHIPEYDYVYYGDTAHLPYGDKSEEEIYRYTKASIEHLFTRGALLVIIACNTASAEATRTLQEEFARSVYADRKILGVIIPTVETLVECQGSHALLIGTTRTIESRKYERELQKLNAPIKLISRATPELVPLIEAGAYTKAHAALKAILEETGSGADTLVLGCTHYALIKEYAEDIFEGIVISQDDIIPEKLERYLKKHPEIENGLRTGGTIEIELSERNPRYEKITHEFFGE